MQNNDFKPIIKIAKDPSIMVRPQNESHHIVRSALFDVPPKIPTSNPSLPSQLSQSSGTISPSGAGNKLNDLAISAIGNLDISDTKKADLSKQAEEWLSKSPFLLILIAIAIVALIFIAPWLLIVGVVVGSNARNRSKKP